MRLYYNTSSIHFPVTVGSALSSFVYWCCVYKQLQREREVLSDNNTHCLFSMSTKQKGAQSDIGAEKVIPTKQDKNKANYNANQSAISAQKKKHTIKLIGML